MKELNQEETGLGYGSGKEPAQPKKGSEIDSKASDVKKKDGKQYADLNPSESHE